MQHFNKMISTTIPHSNKKHKEQVYNYKSDTHQICLAATN